MRVTTRKPIAIAHHTHNTLHLCNAALRSLALVRPCLFSLKYLTDVVVVMHVGKFNNGSYITCESCPIGTAASSVGSANCTTCIAPHYSDRTGLVTCKECPAGSYFIQNTQVTCTTHTTPSDTTTTHKHGTQHTGQNTET